MLNLVKKFCDKLNKYKYDECMDYEYNTIWEDLANKVKSQIPKDLPEPMEFPCCGGYGFEWHTDKGILTMIISNKPVYSFVIDINNPENEYGYITDYESVFQLVRKIV